jgi:ABC-2 type transport system ATP-binding protein
MSTIIQNRVVADTSQPATAAPQSPVIELQGLSVHFGNREILKDLTCSLGGRAIGLLGPNGAGKSTLINTLLGFYKPCSGSARVLGHDIRTEVRSVRSLVGYMPENDALISKMSAVSFVQMMAELSGLPPAAALERAHEALFCVGLAEARYRELGTYSLGMKQLAKLAQAIAHGPKLLILDEPTNGLDPSARQRMIRMIRDIRDSQELQIVLSSHLLRDVEETCEEVLILNQGRIAHYANLDEERKANKRFLELETYGGSGDFTEAVEKLGCECATTANRLKMILADGVEIRDIYRIAAERNVRIRRLNFRRHTLEDIFLKAMEMRAETNSSKASGAEGDHGCL